MRVILLFLFILSFTGLRSQEVAGGYLSNFIMQRTEKLRFKGSTATCFAHSDSNYLFLVTVKHLFVTKVLHKKYNAAKKDFNLIDSPLCRNGDKIKIELFHEKKWQRLDGDIYFDSLANNNIDLAIIRIELKSNISTLYLLDAQAFPGQECLFAGYPLNFRSQTGDALNFDLPIVKFGIFSGAFFNEETKENIVLLDGNNTYGLSGSPIFINNSTTKMTRIFGMVCGYYKQTDSVLNVDSGKYEVKEENSGIIKGISYTQILDLINQHR